MEFRLKSGMGLSISEDHISVMVECIRSSKINETGGILIGYYTEDLKHSVITKVTKPPADSLSGRYWFKRGIKGLKSLLKDAWKKKEYYLGEWHFHPLGTTNPSNQDLKQMLEIANSKDYHCPEAIMIIIAGTAANYVIKPFLTDKKKGLTLPMFPIND